MANLTLAHGLSFCDLYENDGLSRIDTAFIKHLKGAEGEIGRRLLDARSNPSALDEKATSDLILAMAPHIDDFLGHLFAIEAETRKLAERHHDLAPLFACKRLFVQRQAAKKIKADEAATIDGAGPFQRFTDITLPQLRDVLVVVVLLRAIWDFKEFDLIYLMTGGGPVRATQTLSLLVYEEAFRLNRMGMASTYAVAMMLVLLGFTLVYLRQTNRLEEG